MSYWKKIDDLVVRVLDWLFSDDKSTVDVNEVYEDEKPPVVRNKRTKTEKVQWEEERRIALEETRTLSKWENRNKEISTKGKGSQKPKSKKGRGRPKGSKKKKTKIAQKSWPR